MEMEDKIWLREFMNLMGLWKLNQAREVNHRRTCCVLSTYLIHLHKPTVCNLNHIHFAVENATFSKRREPSQGRKVVPNE